MPLSKLLYRSVLWRVIALATVFVMNVMLSRLLEATMYGKLFFLVNYLALGLVVVGLSMESGLSYYRSKKQITDKYSWWFSICWSLSATCLLVACLWILSPEAFYHNNHHLLLYGSFYIAGNLLISFFTPLFISKRQFIVPNVIIAIINIASSLLFILGWNQDFLDAMTIANLFLASFLIQGLLMALAYTRYFRNDRPKLGGDAGIAKITRYSLYVFIGNLVVFFVYRVDYWFVDYYCADKSLLGNYIQVSKLGQLFFIIPSILGSTIFSLSASDHRLLDVRKLEQLSRIIFSSVLLGCMLLIFFGYWLFPFIFGNSFNMMYLPFVLCVPGILALSTLYPLTAYNAGKNQAKYNTIGACIAFAVIIAGDIILIPLVGIAGAAIASSIGYIAYKAYILSGFKKMYALQIRTCFLVRKKDIRLLFASFNKIRE